MKLGSQQIEVFNAIKKHKVWHPGCRWVWGTPSRTKTVLNGLVRKGLVNINNGIYEAK